MYSIANHLQEFLTFVNSAGKYSSSLLASRTAVTATYNLWVYKLCFQNETHIRSLVF
jgi:hypothetical protein